MYFRESVLILMNSQTKNLQKLQKNWMLIHIHVLQMLSILKKNLIEMFQSITKKQMTCLHLSNQIGMKVKDNSVQLSGFFCHCLPLDYLIHLLTLQTKMLSERRKNLQNHRLMELSNTLIDVSVESTF